MTDEPLRVFGLAADEHGCGEFRIFQPMKALLEKGHTVGARVGVTPEELDAVDTVIGQRLCRPNILEFWSELKSIGNHQLIFEIDDDLFNLDPENDAAYNYYTQPEIRQNIISMLRMSDKVFCTTQALKNRVYKYNKNVFILPNYMPREIFQNRPVSQDVDVPVIGWAGGMNHHMDWRSEGPLVDKFFQAHPDHPFKIVGAPYQPFVPSANNFTHHRGDPSVNEYHKLLDFQIGLCIVKPHVFNASKSYLKALEYSARGIIPVCTDYETYRGFINHGEDGFLVRDNEYQEVLEFLVNNPEERKRIANNAYRKAQGHIIDDNIWRYEEAIRA